MSSTLSAIDSKPTKDHINGQVMTLKDKRIVMGMLMVKRDFERDRVAFAGFRLRIC